MNNIYMLEYINNIYIYMLKYMNTKNIYTYLNI